MAIKKILLLGNPILYQKSSDILKDEIEQVKIHVNDLHDTLHDFRNQFNYGRAIAAPQIGVMQRLIYMYIDKPIVFINPIIYQFSPETFEIWDECTSFPNLLVKVNRHKSCKIRFKDLNWDDQEMLLEDDLSELIQHEYDHLDGKLAVQRAIDCFSFAIRRHNYESADI